MNFISGGLMGDFIQSLFAVKNMCEKNNCKANLFITDGHGGDVFSYGVQKAYDDVVRLVYHQQYIQTFQILNKNVVGDSLVNLNMWREEAATEFHEDGEYKTCWSERLAKRFGFDIPSDYKWITPLEVDYRTKDKIVIHRSKHRWGGLPWQKILDEFHGDKIVFVTTNRHEYDLFREKFRGYVHIILLQTITELVNAIGSCKYFIGNQSAPFSIASALDVPRLAELEAGVWKFYKDETKYSKNLSWYLSEEEKYFTPESIIKL